MGGKRSRGRQRMRDVVRRDVEVAEVVDEDARTEYRDGGRPERPLPRGSTRSKEDHFCQCFVSTRQHQASSIALPSFDLSVSFDFLTISVD